MKNKLIDSCYGRMTSLQEAIVAALIAWPEESDRGITKWVETSAMHVGRTRKRFLETITNVSKTT